MIEIWQAVLLAIVQGLTEFLPVSSSAHLILVPHLTGWADQGLAFDVAVHLGTLIAVVAYFRDELRIMSIEWGRSLVGGGSSKDSRLAWAVLWGTVPVGLAGLLLSDFVESALRSPLVIAWATIGFGLLLWWADRTARRNRDEYSIGWRDVLVIGCAQALALVPGTSRSGITITAGLWLGLDRAAAARFSFLLSIPVITLAGGMQALKLAEQGVDAPWLSLAVATLVAALSAYLCIHLFLRILERMGMLPFVCYRLLLGGVLLFVYF